MCKPLGTTAQQRDCKRMISIYDENDVFKLLGPLSDKGYTNGSQISFYYTKDHPSSFFLYKLMPKADGVAINTFGWALMQILYTPENYKTTLPDTKDWPYSASLSLTHSLQSANPVKKYLLKTELTLGIMGPPALGRQVQTSIHSVIGSAKPQGWDKQYPTDLLLNMNLAAEKQLVQWQNHFDLLTGATAMAGTFMDGGSIYLQGRLGILNPWFNGFIGQRVKQFSGKALQAYLLVRPGLDLIVYDALLQGGLFSGKSDYYKQHPDASINHSISRRLDIGLMISYGRIGASFTQTILQREVDGFAHQRVGSLALNVGW